MKNSRGFISISLLIILSISLSLALLTGTRIREGLYLLNTGKNSTELLRGLNNRLILCGHDSAYSSSFIEEIVQDFRKGSVSGLSGQIRIRDQDAKPVLNRPYVSWQLVDLVDKNKFELSSLASYKNSHAGASYSFSFLNPIFLDTKNEASLKEEEIRLIDERILLDHARAEFYNPKLRYFLEEGATLICRQDDNYLLEGSLGKKYFNKEPIYLIIKGDRARSKLYIEREELLEAEVYRPVSLSGIIYVDGDLLINNDFNFKGILLVNGKLRIKEGIKVSLEGFLRAMTIESKDIYTYKYNRTMVIKDYGTYIPGFIDLKLINIRSEG